MHFPDIPHSIVDELSSDQHYAYRICMAVMVDSMDEDLYFLEVGAIVHSRWLTFACRILRLYVSKRTPSANLQAIARFCISVYFPTWFEIKKQSQILHGAKISSTWSIAYNSFHTTKFAVLRLKLCKETFFSLILKMFLVYWRPMMKKLEDW